MGDTWKCKCWCNLPQKAHQGTNNCTEHEGAARCRVATWSVNQQLGTGPVLSNLFLKFCPCGSHLGTLTSSSENPPISL
ncbi:hypothetical protein XELAEV_18023631mg [Xenopus laevis]|uniref:Uncharacterized protein n=1 Tax=Xenopus laevis TaxID=8355 RepID=A0A974D4H3_XENLA|nr:hypothetical protein XELAEV_18023631mg [Xenopus laevis]